MGDLAGRLAFDAIEILNGSPLMEVANARAARRLRRATAAAVGGSDAHVAQAVGAVHTVFPGESAADLRAALLAGTTRPSLDLGRHLAALPGHAAWQAWLLLSRKHKAERDGDEVLLARRGRGTPRPYRSG